MKKSVTISISLFFALLVSIFVTFVIRSDNKSNSTPDVSFATITTTVQATTSPTDLSDSVSADNSTRTATKQTAGVTDFEYSFPMDINLADADALMQTDEIGTTLADAIISYRKQVGVIHDMNELLTVNGIGEAKLASLKYLFYVSDEHTVTSALTTEMTAPVKTTKATAVCVTTTVVKERRIVNINTADVDEIVDCLLITNGQAEGIVSFREEIGGYENILEILYCDTISDSLFISISDYLTVE